MKRLVALAALACACGDPRLEPDGGPVYPIDGGGVPGDSPTDTPVDGSSGVDAPDPDAPPVDAPGPDAPPIDAPPPKPFGQHAYFKASNTERSDWFGYQIALSADGSTLAISAEAEASIASGVNGDQTNNDADSAGAVYVFVRSAGGWEQQAYIKASNPDAFDYFGSSLALSADGSTLAVGAYFESSAARGINGDQTDNDGFNAGAVYVFTRSGTRWTQQAYLKASNADAEDYFGEHLALSADGATLAVAATGEDSNANGADGNQANDAAPESGAVYVFRRSLATWSQQAYLKASNTGTDDQFGSSVALSGDGATLAVGASSEDSNAKGVDGDPDNNGATDSGAVYVFRRTGAAWKQESYLKSMNSERGDFFGDSTALSSDGSTLVVAALGEDSGAVGINGDATSNSASGSGAVYVFQRTGDAWAQRTYVKASNTHDGYQFGRSLALSGDGTTLAVGAYFESSMATGIDGNQQHDEAAFHAGAAYLFKATEAGWTQRSYVKASNTDFNDLFGFSLALSGNGATLAVGAYFESSPTKGLNGDQGSNDAPNSGSAYLFE